MAAEGRPECYDDEHWAQAVALIQLGILQHVEGGLTSFTKKVV